MKTYKNLYPKVCNFENLHIAYFKARKGKRGKAHVAGFVETLKVFLANQIYSLQENLA
jgi:hypothetical protein